MTLNHIYNAQKMKLRLHISQKMRHTKLTAKQPLYELKRFQYNFTTFT